MSTAEKKPAAKGEATAKKPGPTEGKPKAADSKAAAQPKTAERKVSRSKKAAATKSAPKAAKPATSAQKSAPKPPQTKANGEEGAAQVKPGTRASGPLANIDLGLVDALCSLRADRLVVDGRLEKLERESGSVSPDVLQRVRNDYLAQRQELDQKARPLEAQAREEYAQVRKLLADAETIVEGAKKDMEELELRHRLGEFEEADFKERSKGLAAELVKKAKSLEAVEKVRARFLEAFESEADLELDAPVDVTGATAAAPVAGTPSAAGTSQTPPVPPVPATATKSGDTTDVDPVLSEATELVELPPPPPSVAGRSGFVPEATDGPSPTPSVDATGPVTGSADGGTVILPPPARLAPEDPEGGESEPFVLGLVTSIGRTPDNQLQINLPEVSRRHAQISLTESGYRFEDLGSENGSYVNGDAVTEVLLQPGDRVQIGSRRFVFETG